MHYAEVRLRTPGSTCSNPMLTGPVAVGLNVVRMNFSHGSHEYHQKVIDNAHEAEKTQPGRPLAIALDTVQQHR